MNKKGDDNVQNATETQNITEIIRYCQRQRKHLYTRADEMEAKNIPATVIRATAATYDDVIDFIIRLRAKK